MTRRNAAPSPLTSPGGHVPRYRSRIFDDPRHDPFQEPDKYAVPTRCPQCQAVFERKRWRWGAAPPGARSRRCPACRRVQQQMPAGVLTLDGAFVAAHKADLLRTARNEAEHEAAEHPMHRIMRIDEREGAIEIATTDVHLPQRIGEALRRAHHGELSVRYGKDEYSVRARWHR